MDLRQKIDLIRELQNILEYCKTTPNTSDLKKTSETQLLNIIISLYDKTI